MTDARLLSRRHRSLPVAVFGLLLAVTATNQGCTCTQETVDPNPPGGGEFTIKPAANDGAVFHSPFDATPSPAGDVVYFTGINAEGDSGVFKVPAAGGTVETLYAGDLLASPFGIAVSNDGSRLFVSDTGARVSEDEDAGLIFVLPTAGGEPVPLAGAESTRPTGIEVFDDGGTDVIFFSGADKLTGEPGVFKISADGGALTQVSSGGILEGPSGIAITKAGEVYVADALTEENGSATVYLLDAAGMPGAFVKDLAVGYPVGLALTADDAQLLVSGLDPISGTDAVFIYDVTDPATVDLLVFPAEIAGDTFYESAGLHRAKSGNVFAWADSKANKTGTVYVVSQ
jgi:sugar lactone lactonase YvrE